MLFAILRAVNCWSITVVFLSSAYAFESFPSHAPTRPLPYASSRPMSDGPRKFVDAKLGEDTNPGTQEKPWRTLTFAITKLQPGDTLYLRGGTYHEHVVAHLVGTFDKPITIRVFPNELATVDGGVSEFLNQPATAWEPYPEGAPGEFRSTKTYPGIETKSGDLQVSLLGNFADSLLPLHGYWHHPDLQSDNPYWTLGGGEKVKPDAHVYCGPGLWYDRETERIHCRLTHIKLPSLGANNYTGETDPRKVPLVIAGWGNGAVLKLDGCRHVRLQDMALRGARQHTLDVRGGSHLELEGLTLYGGQSCLMAEEVNGLRMSNTACRGLAAPWTFRGSLKYRSIESRLVRTGGWDPSGADGRNYEFAYCEFTDSVDGVFIGNIHSVYFHHNLVENVSDDAIFVTSPTGYDGVTPGGEHHFYQNRFARNLTCFAFGVGHGRQKMLDDKTQMGSGLWITRNIFDLRGPVMYRWPSGPDDVQELDSYGRFGGDHGSPAWEPMWIYHNTLLTGEPTRAEYAQPGIGSAMGKGTTRRVFNNIFFQTFGRVKDALPPTTTDFIADGNLFWSATDGSSTLAASNDFQWCRKFRQSPEFEKSKVRYPPGWTTHDKFADPKFVAYDSMWPRPVDLRLSDTSPAVEAGVHMPNDWFDPLRSTDDNLPNARRPDIGALPKGAAAWRLGCYGRLDANGNDSHDALPISFAWHSSSAGDADAASIAAKSAVIVCGYPAFDAPLVEYALRKAGAKVEVLDKQWLEPKEYSRYSTVVVDGSLARAKMIVDRYSNDDLRHVLKFIEDGGTLWLCRERIDLFVDPAGKKWLATLGISRAPKLSDNYQLAQPAHRWVSHLTGSGVLPWLAKSSSPLLVKPGQVILGTKTGMAALAEVPIGRGNLIYLAWSPAMSLPNGRAKITMEEEVSFSEQMQIVMSIAASLYPTAEK